MVVLDASVILKWFVTEEGSDAALRFRDRHVSGEERIVIPPLLFYEIANVLRYHEQLPNGELLTLFEILKDLEISTIYPSFSEFEEAMLYARSKKISVYDAAYVMLARNIGCELITADQRLVRTVDESFVKPLGV